MSDNESKFDIRFDVGAAKEYQKIKQPDLTLVNKSIDELMFRADEIGKPLGNKRDMKLAGCREIKLRDAGIRIIYRVSNEIVEVLRVVYILAIEKRSRDFVFKIASVRLNELKNTNQILDSFEKAGRYKKRE
ncbi:MULTISPECIES: type II toxin-antitoxin system RelE/ParE family toxin [unclassified Sporosarcina]|uniref:type II toxin-antitoxin system RelE family toxin n=1 Tax=unclassified Sporosarcina TaxID=2647733 RepID=UPI0020411F89|nr:MULTISPECIES: hypothetical protein [unclassified Sporosarcina]GKV65627.1 hypothetical protein NCCP2331_17800 [Sporosarcina sp. NCCP-2331]GLB55793.1 hypothetical protein NCCP2378_15800 [Sporosarcina sp. NCCP-2378]